jgi:DNA-binding MarR family transcriptional regulator
VGSHASPSNDDAATVLDAIRKLVRFLRLADSEAQATTGLSAAQLYILHQLAERPASSVAELARRTLTDPSSASTVVERLVRRGMVRRIRARDDARRVEIRLTPIGERILRNAPRAPQERIAQRVQALPAVRRGELLRALAVLVETVGAEDQPPRMLFEDEPALPRRSRSAAVTERRRPGAGRRSTAGDLAWSPRT